MRKLILTMTIAIASMAAAPAATAGASNDQSKASAPATQQSPTSSTTAAAAEEKKICKLLPSSYSHHSDRVCLTKSDWEKVDQEVGN